MSLNLIDRREFMKAYLDDRNCYKKYLISKRAVAIVNFVIASFKCRSTDVAVKFDISVQSASTQLKKLYDVGYLSRDEFVSESGGIEYEYRCVVKQRPPITLSATPAIWPKNLTIGKDGYHYYHE